MPLKPCWNKLLASRENTKTCLSLISGQKLRSETGFTCNNVNPKFNSGFVNTCDNTCRHLSTPILAPETYSKDFVLVSMLFSLQMQA